MGESDEPSVVSHLFQKIKDFGVFMGETLVEKLVDSGGMRSSRSASIDQGGVRHSARQSLGNNLNDDTFFINQNSKNVNLSHEMQSVSRIKSRSDEFEEYFRGDDHEI